MKNISEKEFFNCYKAAAKVIEDYKKWNPLQKDAAEMDSYGDADKEVIDMMLNLRAIGLSRKKQEEYIRLAVTGGFYNERMSILREQRKNLLYKVHELEKKISCIDCLSYRLESKH